jgi:hypothetical protein
LPATYTRETVRIEADKAAIRKAIKDGETVPGARIEERSHIQIK